MSAQSRAASGTSTGSRTGRSDDVRAVPAGVDAAGWVRWGPYATNGHRTYRQTRGGRWECIAPVFARVVRRATGTRVYVTGLGHDGSEIGPVEQGDFPPTGRFIGRVICGSGICARALTAAMNRTRTEPAELTRAWRGLSRAMDAHEIGAAA